MASIFRPPSSASLEQPADCGVSFPGSHSRSPGHTVSRSVATCLLTLLVIFLAAPAQAAPDLGTYRDIGQVRLYQDHQKRQIWYLAPAPPVLGKNEDGTPDYGLEIYRYLGTKATGDRTSFWVRGLLTVGISRRRSPDLIGRIRQALRASGVSGPRLRSMPVSGAEVTVIFADQSQSWTLGSRWAGSRLVLALEPRLAEVLWDAVAAGQTLVSLAVEERLTGVRWLADKWQAAETAASWTLPIELDMRRYPGHFHRTDLGGRMSRGYTGIDVFCFDFLEGLDPELYAKIVEVAIPTSGRDLVEKVTFRPGGSYRSRIRFQLAKELDRPYRVRIIRILKNGERRVGPWMDKAGETMLDVTAYRNLEKTGHLSQQGGRPEQ